MNLNQFDSCIQNFIQKSVQVIVQSRLGTQATQTKCRPDGKDWFNLNITDIKDILDITTKCLKSTSNHQSQFFLRKEWKICCEISLKNSDGITIVLEYWLFSNLPLSNDKETQDEKKTLVLSEIFIRMSNMLKSLIVLTRSTPAHRLSSKGQSADSYVICYRVYQIKENFNDLLQSSDHSSHYSSVQTIGSIRSHLNELSFSLIYRTDMNINSESEIKNLEKIDQKSNEPDDLLLSLKDDHFKKVVQPTVDMFDIIKPLNPAFAGKERKHSEPDLNTPFSSLLPSFKETFEWSKSSLDEQKENKNGLKTNPISIPVNGSSKSSSKSPQIYSTSNESFVFVELNAPFASEDSVLSSFFHGPSPTFINNQEESNNDIDELSLQLAELESNASNIDNFVESICLNENEEFRIET